MSTGGSGLGELMGAAAYYFEQNRRFLPMYAHLLASALFPIYIGAYASLSKPSSAAKRIDVTNNGDDDDDDDKEEEADTIQKMEGLTPKDAIMFPITAGLVLAGLYYLIKAYGASVVNTVLGVYFSVIGTYSVAKLINDAWTTIESYIAPTYYEDDGIIWKLVNRKRTVIQVYPASDSNTTRPSPLAGPLGRLPLPGSLLHLAWALRDLTKQRFLVTGFCQDVFDFRAVLTRHNVISAVLGIAVIGYSFIDKPWYLTNLQGFAVSYGALQLMSPTTFATGTLILSGLFFYDIWAVFFTPLMVTVAKNLDVPIKLLFPRPLEPGESGKPPVRTYSMLGLGDIVLPGLMIALALRFDLYMHYLRQQNECRAAQTDQDAKSSSSAVSPVKIPYVTVTGHWGDKYWTSGKASTSAAANLPAYLSATFSKTYFHASLAGYICGMITTLIFMSIFDHAQPALLYLVPGVLITLWGTGAVRGELRQMWEFTESLTDDEDHQSDSEGQVNKAPRSIWSQLWTEMFGSSNVETAVSKGSNNIADATSKSSISTGEKDISEDKDKDKSKNGDIIFSFSIRCHMPKSSASASPSEHYKTSSKPVTDGKGQGAPQ